MAEFNIDARLKNQTTPLAKNLETGKYEAFIIAPDSLIDINYDLTISASDESGNKSTVSKILNITSIWIDPKINWISKDFVNIEDWRRIIGNLLYLRKLAVQMYTDFSWEYMGDEKKYSDFPTSNEFNAVEINIVNLIENTFVIKYQKSRIYKENDAFLDYLELNRIENTTLKIYEILKGQYDGIKTLAITLGGDEFGN